VYFIVAGITLVPLEHVVLNYISCGDRRFHFQAPIFISNLSLWHSATWVLENVTERALSSISLFFHLLFADVFTSRASAIQLTGLLWKRHPAKLRAS
jgi:hypothetical protein